MGLLNAEFAALPDRVKRELFAFLPDFAYLALGWGMLQIDDVARALRTAIAEGHLVIEEQGIETRTEGDDESTGFLAWAMRARAQDNAARGRFWTEALSGPSLPLVALLTDVFQRDVDGRLAQRPAHDFMPPPHPDDIGYTSEPPPAQRGDGFAGRVAQEFERDVLSHPDGLSQIEAYAGLREAALRKIQQPLAGVFLSPEDERAGENVDLSFMSDLDIGPGITWRAALYINAHSFNNGKYFEDWPVPIERRVTLLGNQYGETAEERARAAAEALTDASNPDRLAYRIQRFRPDGPSLPRALREAVAKRLGVSTTRAGEYLVDSGFTLPRDLLFTLRKH